MELIGQIPINWSWARQVGGQAGEGDHREVRSSYSTKNKGGPWKMADDGAIVVYRGLNNQSEGIIHHLDSRSDNMAVPATVPAYLCSTPPDGGGVNKTISHFISV